MRSPVRVCICRNAPSSMGKKRVRINPVVERTTIAPKPRYIRDQYHHNHNSRRRHRLPSPYYHSFSDEEVLASRRRPTSRDRNLSVRSRRRYLPPSPSIIKSRMRSPQRDRPLYDDDDEIPRVPRIRRASQNVPKPAVNDPNVIFKRKNHHFARGDALTHKNLTRTYVFHRQPFDWYDTSQGIVVEDIEQILEPEDLYEPEELIPASPRPPSRPSYEPFDPPIYYEQQYAHSGRPRSANSVSNGYSNQFYDDVYVSTQPEPEEIAPKRPSPDLSLKNSNRPTAFRPPATNRNKPNSHFTVEKQTSPSQVKTFRSSEFISPNDSSEIETNPRKNKDDRVREASYDLTGDIDRIMKKFDQIGITDQRK